MMPRSCHCGKAKWWRKLRRLSNRLNKRERNEARILTKCRNKYYLSNPPLSRRSVFIHIYILTLVTRPLSHNCLRKVVFIDEKDKISNRAILFRAWTLRKSMKKKRPHIKFCRSNVLEEIFCRFVHIISAITFIEFLSAQIFFSKI